MRTCPHKGDTRSFNPAGVAEDEAPKEDHKCLYNPALSLLSQVCVAEGVIPNFQEGGHFELLEME